MARENIEQKKRDKEKKEHIEKEARERERLDEDMSGINSVSSSPLSPASI